jgi:porin
VETAGQDEADDIVATLRRADISENTQGARYLEEFAKARKQWQELIGLDYAVTYHAYGAAIAGGDDSPAGGSGELALLGSWAPGKNWSENPVTLNFRLRQRHAFGRLAPASLGQEIGALWGIADGFTDAGFQVPDFYFQHLFTRSDIELRYGQMSLDSQFDSYALSGAKQSFLNQAFASHPAAAFPSYGAGATLAKTFDNGFGIGIGASNVQGTTGGEPVDLSFESTSLFQCAQFSYDFKACGSRASRVELLLWHSDSLESADFKEGQGASITWEQEIDGPDLRAFARLSAADGGATKVDLFTSGGLGWLVNDRDLLGVAVGIGRGSDSRHSVQSVIEGFYRWQPRDGIQISPDFQILAGEGFVGTPGLRFVLGLRAGIQF